MKFILTAETTDSYSPVSNISIPLWSEYCDRHGYEFSVRNVVESERGPVWERVPHMLEKLKECDWVVHIDLDAIPTNFHIPLTEFIRPSKCVNISLSEREDGSKMFNDGIVMINKSYELSVSRMWDLGDDIENKIFCFQDRLWEKYAGDMSTNSWINVVPQSFFNAFDYREYGMPESTTGQWHKGSFVIHFPGCSTEKRVELLNRYKEEIIR